MRFTIPLLILIAMAAVAQEPIERQVRFLDMQPPDDPSWSPDGSQVVYSSQLKAPRPSSHLFVRRSDGTIDQITSGPDDNDTSPQFSPDGNWIVFLRSHLGPDTLPQSAWGSPRTDLMVTTPDDRTTRTLLARDGLVVERPRWSPDGKKIAFLSDGDVFVYHFETGWVEQVTSPAEKSDPSRFTEAEWSPDSARLALVQTKTNRRQDPPPRSRRVTPIVVYTTDGTITVPRPADPQQRIKVPPPFTALVPDPIYTGTISSAEVRTQALSLIQVLDLATRALTRISDGALGQDSDPAWSPDGRHIAFVSGGTLNPKVGIARADGSASPRSLTAGSELEELEPSWSPDGQRIVLVQRDKDSRYARMVLASVESPGTQELVNEPGWVESPRYITRDTIGYRFGSPRQVTDLYTFKTETAKLTDSMNGIDPQSLAAAEKITFKSRDGLEIKAWLWKPAKMRQGEKYPAFVLIHGGPTSEMTSNFNAVNQYFIEKGYVFLGPNFRGSTSEGDFLRDANGADWGGGDLDDVVWAAKWLQEQPYVDASRIGAWGGSYGGYLGQLAVTRFGDIFKTAIAGYGVTDRSRFAKDDFGDPELIPERYFRGSAINYMRTLRHPIFFWHGTLDVNVPYEQALMLKRELDKYGKTYEFVSKDNEAHGFRVRANRIEVYSRIEKFLIRHFPPGPVSQ